MPRGSLPLPLTGKRFGKLTAVSHLGRSGNETMWLCRCDCGAEIKVALGSLHGTSRSLKTSCGLCDPPSSSGEFWSPIRGYEGLYEVSDQGSVRRLGNTDKCSKTRPVKPSVMKRRGGYHCVGLWKDGKGAMHRLHRLVAQAFIGEIRVGMVVNHKNGVKSDNRLENLEIVTPLENTVHAMENGLLRVGENSAVCSVLNNDLVRQIHEIYVPGVVSYKRVARILGIGRWEYVRNVIKGRSWKHLRPNTNQVSCEEEEQGGPQSTPLVRPLFSQTENAVAVRAGISYAADVPQAKWRPSRTLDDVCFPR